MVGFRRVPDFSFWHGRTASQPTTTPYYCRCYGVHSTPYCCYYCNRGWMLPNACRFCTCSLLCMVSQTTSIFFPLEGGVHCRSAGHGFFFSFSFPIPSLPGQPAGVATSTNTCYYGVTIRGCVRSAPYTQGTAFTKYTGLRTLSRMRPREGQGGRKKERRRKKRSKKKKKKLRCSTSVRPNIR